MKKLSIFLLALVASAGTMFAWDYESVQIGDLCYNLDATNQTAEVSGWPWPTPIMAADIPASVTYNDVSYSVTSIGYRAFRECGSLTSVNIPNSVTSIGEDAFEYCNSLVSVNIPNSVTSIGDFAFSGCNSLPIIDNIRYADTYLVAAVDKNISSCNISETTRFIGNRAFEDCSNLTSVEIPNSVTSIGSEAFKGCRSLTSIEIPNSVTSIGECAFRECNNLVSANIPNSVTSIEKETFAYCRSLTSVTIPGSVTSIGEGAFWYCSSLTSVTIPSSVTSIGELAFADCSGLTSMSVEAGNTVYDSRNNCNAIIETASNMLVAGCQNTTIPNSVTSIGRYAFRGCSKLISMNIPNSVVSIGVSAFADCSNLTEINLPEGITEIGMQCFYGCRSLTSIIIPDGVTAIYAYAFRMCTGLESVIIPNSVTYIQQNAFYDCSGLKSVTIGNQVSYIPSNCFWNTSSLESIIIPSSVTKIEVGAYGNCSSLISISVETENNNYDSRNDCNAIIETSSNKLVLGCKNTIIPSSVTSIERIAFYGCSGLTSVTIPNSIISIGERAFIDCSNLTNITCEAVTPPTLGDNVFNDVDKSIPLYVPAESVDAYKAADQWKEFDVRAMIPCNSTEYIDENLSWVFSCDGVLTISGNGAMPDFTPTSQPWFEHMKNIQSVIIESGVTSIGRSAFNGCSNLTSISIPNSVTSIGNEAFSNCSSLPSIEIPNSVTSIGLWAFDGCTSLTQPVYNAHVFAYLPRFYSGAYSIPDGIEQIAGQAFHSCKDMTSIEIQNSVEYIEGNAFYRCYGLTSVSIPNSVTYIGRLSFAESYGLTTLIINNGVIDELAFDRCGLTTLTLGSGVTSIASGAFYSCTGLTSVTCEAVNPPTLMSNHGKVFAEVDCSQIPLYVPAESIDAYKAADQWKEFTNILPIGGMDIDHPTNPGTYQLTLNMSIDDAGVVTGAGMYAQGTEVSVSATANTGYTFERWSDGVTDASRTITMIARDSTLTAIFSINRYTITFVDEDGTTVLASDEYEYGATPVAPANPTKAATAQYTYTFNGWSPAIATVTEAATYTATYSQTVNKYTITFLDEDGTTVLSSDEYDYGATPVAPADPTKAATEDNYFVFNGWDKPLTTVTAAATYTATYNSFLNNVTISGNQDLAELAVGENTHVTIGANDTLTISSPVTIATLTFSTNGNNASQINGIENLTLTNAEVIIRLEPVANTATANKWYAFGVPFEVEVTGGIYAQGSESPAVYNSAFVLDEYDGALRASSQDGWKRVASSATLRPGVLYMIAISGTTNEWRMVKRAEAAFTESASLSVNAYPSAIGAHHAGWNGLANTLLHSATASLTDVEYITTYNNALSVYEVSPIAEVSLATAQPFFVQTPQAGTINFAKQRANSPARYLQQAVSQTASYTLSLSSDTYTDRAYLTTAADKEEVYCIGRDLVKMQSTTPSVPQLWIVRYDTNLAAYEIPFANDEATMTLGLYAPQAGEYRFGLENISDEYVYTLLYQGIPVTELGDQPTTLSLEQGEHTYALRIAKKPEYITALPDDVQGNNVQCTKILRNGQIFILREDKIYTLTGQKIK